MMERGVRKILSFVIRFSGLGLGRPILPGAEDEELHLKFSGK